MPALPGDLLLEVAREKSLTAGGLDGWEWRVLKALPLSRLKGLADISRYAEDDGRCPEGLLDAYISMIPQGYGDASPLRQRPLCVLPVVCRLWASVWMGH